MYSKALLNLSLSITSLNPVDLRVRYHERKSLSEPWYYIRYQAAIYKALASLERQCAVFDASMAKVSLSNDILTFVLQSLKIIAGDLIY